MGEIVRNRESSSQCVILTHSVLSCLSHLWAQVSPVSGGTGVNGHASSLDFKELPSKRISILVVNQFLAMLWPAEIMKLMEEELLGKEEKGCCNKDLRLKVICETVHLPLELY